MKQSRIHLRSRSQLLFISFARKAFPNWNLETMHAFSSLTIQSRRIFNWWAIHFDGKDQKLLINLQDNCEVLAVRSKCRNYHLFTSLSYVFTSSVDFIFLEYRKKWFLFVCLICLWRLLCWIYQQPNLFSLILCCILQFLFHVHTCLEVFFFISYPVRNAHKWGHEQFVY